MPLRQGSSDEVRYENYRTLRKEGKPEDQAWAIAYSEAGRSRKKALKSARRKARKWAERHR